MIYNSIRNKMLGMLCMLILVSVSTVAASEWSVELNPNINSADKGIWKFGISDAATDGPDIGLDVAAPPIDPNGFDMYFFEPVDNSELKEYGKLRNDFRTTAGWNLIMAVPATSSAYITWTTVDIPATLNLYIQEVDLNTGTNIGQFIDMDSVELMDVSTSDYPAVKRYLIYTSGTDNSNLDDLKDISLDPSVVSNKLESLSMPITTNEDPLIQPDTVDTAPGEVASNGTDKPSVEVDPLVSTRDIPSDANISNDVIPAESEDRATKKIPGFSVILSIVITLSTVYLAKR